MTLPSDLKDLLKGRMQDDELEALERFVAEVDPEEIFHLAKKDSQQIALGLSTAVRSIAVAAPSDASFMIGYDPLLLRRGDKPQDDRPFEWSEIDWWEGLVGFLYVATFSEQLRSADLALQFHHRLVEYLRDFPRVLAPRLAYWQRVSKPSGPSAGFRPD